MLKLIPEQISAQWDTIRASLLVTMPPIAEPSQENLRSILVQLLCEHMQCWLILDEANRPCGYALTYISADPHTSSKTFVIYSLYLQEQVSKTIWEKGYQILYDFAAANKCFRVAAYSSNPTVISISKKFGFIADYSYLVKDIESI